MGSRWKGKMDFFERLRNFYAHHFIQLFLILLSLGCFCGFVTKTCNKVFELLNFLLLLFVGGHECFKFCFAHLFVMSVIARVALELSIKKFVYLVYCNIKKIAVVTYE